MQHPRSASPDSSAPPAGSAPGRTPGHGEFGHARGNAMSMKWAALLDAAAVVCTLAGLQPEVRKPEVRNFPAIMRDTGGWRYDMAQQRVDDLAAIMEPGLAALLAVSARGASPAPAALALWYEYLAMRNALIALIPPLGIRRP